MRQLELGGGDAANALGDDNDDDVKEKAPDRIAKHEIDDADRRKAWEEQRRAAKANREKMRKLELGGGDAADALGTEDNEDSHAKSPDRIAKHEIDDAERRRIYEEQRRETKANREKMRNVELGNGPAPEAQEQQEEQASSRKQEKHQPTADELAELARQQRREARANRERLKAQAAGVNMDRLVQEALGPDGFGPSHGGAKIPRDSPVEQQKPVEQPHDDVQDDEPVPKKQEKHQPTAEELAELARQQRREARANRERLKAQAAGVDMDKLVQEALGPNGFGPSHGGAKIPRDSPVEQQKVEEVKDEEPLPKKQEKHQPTADELAELARQQRREARANRERLKAQAAGVDMDKLVQEALGPEGLGPARGKVKRDEPAPKKEEAAPQPEAANDDNEPVPQKEKQHEITPEERRAAYNEQRAIRKKAEAAAKEGLDELAALEAELNSKPKKVRPPPKFLARLQKKPAADASDDSSSARSSARSIDSDAETPRRKPHNVKVQAAKPVEMPKIEEEPKGMNANFGQALSSKSAKEFLKSRTLVIEQLNQADKAAEENADLPVDPSIEAGNEPTPEEQQSVIEDKAKFIEEALCIDGKEANNDEDFDGHENDENKDSSSFHLAGMSVDLPVAHDSDSCAYRAEALRAFLEKQIGFDRVIELKEMMNNADSDVDMNKYLNDIQPGLVLLVQHLLILDDDASSLRI